MELISYRGRGLERRPQEEPEKAAELTLAVDISFSQVPTFAAGDAVARVDPDSVGLNQRARCADWRAIVRSRHLSSHVTTGCCRPTQQLPGQGISRLGHLFQQGTRLQSFIFDPKSNVKLKFGPSRLPCMRETHFLAPIMIV